MRRIIFWKLGSFSNINASVYNQLCLNFPEFRVETVDVGELIKDDLFSPKNLVCLAWEYGLDFLLRRKSWRSWSDWALVTSYMFKVIKKRVQTYSLTEGLSFTFQTQSMFDGSIPGIPHFVYTDSTVLAYRHYPDAVPGAYMKSRAWMSLETTVYRNATLNFTFSENQSRSITQDYGVESSRVECVYAGSNTRATGDGKGSYSSKNILFVGVNWERKGGPALEQAFQRVLERHPDATLTIVGCSPAVTVSGCRVVGRIPLEEVEAYYGAAAIFCMPTRQEPFGIAYLEAMQRRLPVVASNVGALPEMVIHSVSGLLYDPDDVAGLADGLIQLLDDPARCAAMGEAGYRRYEQIYTWDKTGSRLRESIQRCANLQS